MIILYLLNFVKSSHLNRRSAEAGSQLEAPAMLLRAFYSKYIGFYSLN